MSVIAQALNLTAPIIHRRLTMSTLHTNLFEDVPEHLAEEWFTTLLERPGCRIERIVSCGQRSPEGFWYDQAWDEWVLLLRGSADIDLVERTVALTPGDHLLIPAGQKHRVTRTAPGQATIWLAIHLNAPAKS